MASSWLSGRFTISFPFTSTWDTWKLLMEAALVSSQVSVITHFVLFPTLPFHFMGFDTESSLMSFQVYLCSRGAWNDDKRLFLVLGHACLSEKCPNMSNLFPNSLWNNMYAYVCEEETQRAVCKSLTHGQCEWFICRCLLPCPAFSGDLTKFKSKS